MWMRNMIYEAITRQLFLIVLFLCENTRVGVQKAMPGRGPPALPLKYIYHLCLSPISNIGAYIFSILKNLLCSKKAVFFCPKFLSLCSWVGMYYLKPNKLFWDTLQHHILENCFQQSNISFFFSFSSGQVVPLTRTILCETIWPGLSSPVIEISLFFIRPLHIRYYPVYCPVFCQNDDITICSIVQQTESDLAKMVG